MASHVCIMLSEPSVRPTVKLSGFGRPRNPGKYTGRGAGRSPLERQGWASVLAPSEARPEADSTGNSKRQPDRSVMHRHTDSRADTGADANARSQVQVDDTSRRLLGSLTDRGSAERTRTLNIIVLGIQQGAGPCRLEAFVGPMVETALDLSRPLTLVLLATSSLRRRPSRTTTSCSRPPATRLTWRRYLLERSTSRGSPL
jgi:hypothetical protein